MKSPAQKECSDAREFIAGFIIGIVSPRRLRARLTPGPGECTTYSDLGCNQLCIQLFPMLAIVDSGGANIASVRFALERLGVRSELTADPAVIRSAERVILPGVGAANEGMRKLQERGLVDCVRGLTQPVLGVCLGMQLLFESSEEGPTGTLGLIPGVVRRLPDSPGIQIPHMGWNTLLCGKAPGLLDGIPFDARFYFVHSYAGPVNAFTVASCDHGTPFAAMVQRANFSGVQFHPERSGDAGARLLKNFVEGRV